jgi:hypothetical protein
MYELCELIGQRTQILEACILPMITSCCVYRDVSRLNFALLGRNVSQSAKYVADLPAFFGPALA